MPESLSVCDSESDGLGPTDDTLLLCVCHCTGSGTASGPPGIDMGIDTVTSTVFQWQSRDATGMMMMITGMSRRWAVPVWHGLQYNLKLKHCQWQCPSLMALRVRLPVAC